MKRIRIQHSTTYVYSEPVTLLPHKLMIRPRVGHDIQLESSSLSISPRTLSNGIATSMAIRSPLRHFMNPVRH